MAGSRHFVGMNDAAAAIPVRFLPGIYTKVRALPFHDLGLSFAATLLPVVYT
jgi:hypothetical protein